MINGENFFGERKNFSRLFCFLVEDFTKTVSAAKEEQSASFDEKLSVLAAKLQAAVDKFKIK